MTRPAVSAAPLTRCCAGALAVLATVAATVAVAGAGRPGAEEAVATPLVRSLLLAARGTRDVSASVTVGLLVVAVWCAGEDLRPLLLRGARVASISWVAASAVALLLTAAEVAGLLPGDAGFAVALGSFATGAELGQALVASLVLVLLVAGLAVAGTQLSTITWAAVLSLVALLPLAATGHASAPTQRGNAVDSLALHLVGASVWVGGLVAVAVVATRPGAQLPAVVGRYSRLAGVCFALVAASGVVNALIRLGSLSQLGGPYGRLVLAKSGVLLVLGGLGWLHRTRTIPALARNRWRFVQVAAVELLVMASSMGLGVALSRTEPPPAAAGPTAPELGYAAPPPFEPAHLLTQVHPDALWVGVALVAFGVYLTGVQRLGRYGEDIGWPNRRVMAAAAAALVLAWATSGGLGVYAQVDDRVWVLRQLVLLVLVPVVGAAAAPRTLARLTLLRRDDGTVGAAESIRHVLHSRLARQASTRAGALLAVAVGLAVSASTTSASGATAHTGQVVATAALLAAGAASVQAWSRAVRRRAATLHVVALDAIESS